MKRLLLLLFLLSSIVHAQIGGKITQDPVVLNRQGYPAGGTSIAICQPLSTTGATVTSSLAIFTMSSNPITAGFVNGMQIQVAGFTGGDTYFNNGTLNDGFLVNGLTILSVSSTQIVASFNHANGSASTNGTVLQFGNSATACAGISTVYTDASLVTTQANPMFADGLGNYSAGATPGTYYVQYYGAGVTTTLRQVIVPCSVNMAATCGAGGGGGGSGTVTSIATTSPITGGTITTTGTIGCTTCITGSGGGSIALSSTQIGFGLGANIIGGSNNLTWNNGSALLAIQNAAGGDAFNIINSTAATSLLNQSSPIVEMCGTYFNVTSLQDCFYIQNLTQAGSNPGTALIFSHTGAAAGGGFAFLGPVNIGGTLNVGGTTVGMGQSVQWLGGTSGSAGIQAANIAGTPNSIALPTSTGTSGYLFTTDGGNPQQSSWTNAVPFSFLTASANTGSGTFSMSNNTFDLHASSKVFPVTTGTTAAIPATCTFTAGSLMQMYIATDATAGQNWYYCTATNTWTQQLNSAVSATAFSAITAATNTTAAMVVGTGASLGTSGSGTITATALPFSGLTSATNTTGALVLGTGASLTVSGSGTNNATTLLSNTWSSPAAIGTGTPAAGTFSNLIDSALTPGTLPICPNGSGGLFTTSGCVSGGGVFPVTVSGTTTSGGIPYFSNTTTETSSGILNTNILVKGGGAGGAPTNSSITDNGTTVSTLEPLSSGNASFGGGCSAAGSTASGGICMTESTNTGWTPTSGQDYLRADSTVHAFLCSINGAAEPGCSFSGPVTFYNNGIAATPTDVGKLLNTTASTAGVPVQDCPSVHIGGGVWNTTSVAANNAMDWIMYCIGTSGTGPYSDFELASSINGGAYTPRLSVDSFGNVSGGTINPTSKITLGGSGILMVSATAPSIVGAGCGGSAAAITTSNGTAAFKVNVGTSNTGPCTVTMPAATTDWLCSATDITTTSANVFITKAVPGGSPTTQISLQNYTDAAATHAWTDSDKIEVQCTAE